MCPFFKMKKGVQMLNFVWESLLSWLQSTVISSLDVLDQSMLYAFSPRLITMDHYFPGLNDLWDLVVSVAFGMTLALCIFKLFQNSFLSISKSYESPFITILRTIFAFVVITTIPQLLKYIFEFADIVYWGVLDEGGIDDAFSAGAAASSVLKRVAEAISGSVADLASPDMLTEIFNITERVSLAEFLVCTILTIAIVWNYFKLMLEIAERYVVLGIMYYTMPLAAVPLVSRETSSITKSWLRMVVSELMILVLNVWFIVVFRNAIMSNNMIAGEYEVNGHTVGSGILWCFLAVAFLKTAQKIDSHIATLGLTTAQLGSGVAASLLSTGLGIAGAAQQINKGIQNARTAIARKKALAAGALADSTRNGAVVSNKNMVKDASVSDVAHAMKMNGSNLHGEAAVEAVKKAAPEIVGDKNIQSAKINNGDFTATYKDANGKDATISFTKNQPEGVSKAASYAGMDGYVQDTGSPYNYDDINNGTSFNEYADKYLGGQQNALAASGRFSQQDLDEATVSQNPSGDGIVVKDKNGMEMATISKYDNDHADNISDNTLIGESGDGLYRADINTNERYPLPEGYSYAGDTLVDDNGNAISEVASTGFTTTGSNGNGYENLSGEFINSNGETVSDAHYQDSYITPDGKYISSDEMQSIMKDKTVAPSDYANNLQYNPETGFTDMNGNNVNMDKTGWVDDGTNSGIYTNKYTNGTATGEQIAERYSNPTYASKSYGGFTEDGTEMYYDNYSKDAVSTDNMGNARKYGEMPDYSSFTSGETGRATASGPRNFSESIEKAMDKDYNFTGDIGANIAKAYIPELKNSDIDKAYISKDSIRVNKNNGSGNVQVTSYASEIDRHVSSGSFTRVETANGNKTWLKANRSGDNQSSGSERSSSGNGSTRKNAFDGRNSNPQDGKSPRRKKRNQ